jgi:hypothetical protein
MSLIAKSTGGTEFKNPPTGNHLARCFRITDYGSQTSKYGTQRKILISWELHGEDDEGNPLSMDDGKPFAVSSYYTLSLSNGATLRTMLEQWRNRSFTIDELSGFDLKNILGQWCMVSVSNDKGADGKEYCNVKAVSPVPSAIKKQGLPDGINDIVLFSLDNFDKSIYDSLSEKTRAKIAQSPEYINLHSSSLSKLKNDSPETDSDVPF